MCAFLCRSQRSLVKGVVVVCTAGSLLVKWVFHSVVAQPLRMVRLKNLALLDSIYSFVTDVTIVIWFVDLCIVGVSGSWLRDRL